MSTEQQRVQVSRYSQREGNLITRWDIETQDGDDLLASFYGRKLKLSRPASAGDLSKVHKTYLSIRVDRSDGNLNTYQMKKLLSPWLDWTDALEASVYDEPRTVTIHKSACVGPTEIPGLPEVDRG